MNIVILSLFFTVYYTESLSCSHEKIADVFGPWDTNLGYHVIPSTRRGYGQNIINEVNRIFKHKFTTIYVFGTPMNSLQRGWLRRCSSFIFPNGVIAWGSDLNFIPIQWSSLVSCKKDITNSLDGMYDNNPLSNMAMFLPLATNVTQSCDCSLFS